MAEIRAIRTELVAVARRARFLTAVRSTDRADAFRRWTPPDNDDHVR